MKQILLLPILVLALCFQAFGQEKVDCPTVKVIPPSKITPINSAILFSVSVTGKFDNSKLEYKWTVSNSEILDGQGTLAISVATTREMNGQTITTIVEIKGLPENCPNNFSASGEVEYKSPLGDPFNFDYGKSTWAKERLGLKTIILGELANDPKIIAVFVFYYQKNFELNLIKSRQQKIAKFLKENNIPPNRFRMVDGGKTDSYRTAIWLVPEGSLPPQ